jgi:hypothetical protein
VDGSWFTSSALRRSRLIAQLFQVVGKIEDHVAVPSWRPNALGEPIAGMWGMAIYRESSVRRWISLSHRDPRVQEDKSMSNSLYERDFYAWANEQAALLRAGKLDSADIENIAEEIESMGRSEKRELVNRLAVLLLHLLKWRYQPAFHSTSWRLNIREQRIRLADHLADNPSLKSKVGEAMRDAYRLARVGTARETGLAEDTFPPRCPFKFDQAMGEDFWPD